MARFVNASDDKDLLLFINVDHIIKIWGIEAIRYGNGTSTVFQVKLLYVDGVQQNFDFSTIEKAKHFLKDVCVGDD